MNQSLLGFKKIFSGCIVGQWMSDNKDQTCCKECDRLIVKMCVDLYHEH